MRICGGAVCPDAMDATEAWVGYRVSRNDPLFALLVSGEETGRNRLRLYALFPRLVGDFATVQLKKLLALVVRDGTVRTGQSFRHHSSERCASFFVWSSCRRVSSGSARGRCSLDDGQRERVRER